MKEWEAVSRILVKGYVSISYFPTFLSKACLFIHTSLFNNAGYENWTWLTTVNYILSH